MFTPLLAFNTKRVLSRVDVLFGDEAAQMLRSLESIYTQQTSTAKDSTAQDVYDLLVKTPKQPLKLSYVMLARMMN